MQVRVVGDVGEMTAERARDVALSGLFDLMLANSSGDRDKLYRTAAPALTALYEMAVKGNNK